MAHIATSASPSSFAVSPGSLTTGAALMPVPEHVSLPSVAAATGTPAAAAWSECAESLARLSSTSDASISGLRDALSAAAEDYTTADAASAKSFS